MAKAKLTPGRISAFTTSKAQEFLWDTEVPGLAIRATPSGSRAYIFQGRLNDKDIRVTIGDTRSWLLDAARSQARCLQTSIDQGKDPRDLKRDSIAETVARREQEQIQSESALLAWEEYILERAPRWSLSFTHI